MRTLAALLCLLPLAAQAGAPFLRVQAGIVYNEADHYFADEVLFHPDGAVEMVGFVMSEDTPKLSTTFEAGYEWRLGWSVSIRHISTPEGGCPLDCDAWEYARNEVLLGYKFGGIK